nr:AMP-binding protein [Scytonematopsis contorta HA4267-MV1]
MHHIVSDGWSIGIFVRELVALYQAFSQGVAYELPQLTIQYADFAQWQREWLTGEVLTKQLDYWRHQLAQAPPLLKLPYNRPRPAIQTFAGATLNFEIDTNLTQQLLALSADSRATLFMTLLAGFATLLSRYSCSEDIVIGSPIANRNHSEIEPIIGFFVNTLVLRTNLSENPTFAELLSKVKQVTLEAYAHQDLPFQKLVEELQPERSMSYSPLFQVLFVLQNVPVEKLELPGLTITPLEMDNTTSRFDLTLSITQTESKLLGAWEYNTDLFDAETISCIRNHFQTLLQGIVQQPQQKVSQLSLLSQEERHQLLVEWNQTQTKTLNFCIHQLFEAQVERTPNAVAVVFEQEELTYLELNNKANQLAHHLQKIGVNPEVLVGICLERSPSMVVGLLAILKAGGAYVPLDPNYPTERLSYMLSDAKVSVLLTQATLLDKLPQQIVNRICLDTDWELILKNTTENTFNQVELKNLAYVIYTSGSTGQPKGVAITHQGLINYLNWCTQEYAIAEGSGTLVNSSISFDATITSLFSPLLVGQKVVLILEKEEIEALSNILSYQNNFSLIKITPTHLDILSQLLSNKEIEGKTKALIIGGEALLGKTLQFWWNYAPHTKIINEYGPTETYPFRGVRCACGALAVKRNILVCWEKNSNQNLVMWDLWNKSAP